MDVNELSRSVSRSSTASISRKPRVRSKSRGRIASPKTETPPPIPPRSPLRATPRDSLQSYGSSSVYPMSSASSSGTIDDLRTVNDDEDNHQVLSVDPSYDEDDVSYRLRLLVNNNYFLPPAHAKPSEFAPPSPKPTTPTFLDLFRKKPVETPVLRSTSDSITTARATLVGSPPERPSPRVVVVREQMNDLLAAAKQAEQEMQSRESRRDRDVDPSHTLLDINPTDAVDIPPVSGMFSAQASAAYGLGVKDSVGAAVLAENLPPEDPWRRALLHAAVNHSLNNTPVASIRSPVSSTRSPVSSLSSLKLDQRIIQHTPEEPPVMPVLKYSKSSPAVSTETGYIPSRAVTPLVPPTPLAPAPRPTLSRIASQEDFSSVQSRPSSSILRRSTSTPAIGDEQSWRMTPPPLPTSRLSLSPSVVSQSRPSLTVSLTDGRPSLSEYSQPSPTVSAFRDLYPDCRPSISSDGARAYSDTPPPRASSSLAPTPLSPAPRSTTTYRTAFSRTASSANTSRAPSPAPSSYSTTPAIIVQEATLSVPSWRQPVHSPSSPVSFFDEIQSHPNAMDDLSSDDEEVPAPSPHLGPARLMTYDPPVMNMGNHSTSSLGSMKPVSHIHDRKPVSNIVPKPTFFTKNRPPPIDTHLSPFARSSDEESRRPSSAVPLQRKRSATVAAPRPSTGQAWKRGDESSKRLDGLLMAHMSKEKDTMKRITSQASQSVDGHSYR